MSGVSSVSSAAASMDAFLASLNLRTEILPLLTASAERAAQLTARSVG